MGAISNMLRAAKSDVGRPSEFVGVTGIDSMVGTGWILGCFKWTYCKVYDKFSKAKTKDKIDSMIARVLTKGELFEEYNRTYGNITDGDKVTIMEALEWTRDFVVTGEKSMVYLAYVAAAGEIPAEDEIAVHTGTMWTCVVRSKSITSYLIINGLHKEKPVDVLNKSMDKYTIKLVSTKER